MFDCYQWLNTQFGACTSNAMVTIFEYHVLILLDTMWCVTKILIECASLYDKWNISAKTFVKHQIVPQNMVFEDDHQIIIDNAP